MVKAKVKERTSEKVLETTKAKEKAKAGAEVETGKVEVEVSEVIKAEVEVDTKEEVKALAVLVTTSVQESSFFQPSRNPSDQQASYQDGFNASHGRCTNELSRRIQLE